MLNFDWLRKNNLNISPFKRWEKWMETVVYLLFEILEWVEIHRDRIQRVLAWINSKENMKCCFFKVVTKEQTNVFVVLKSNSFVLRSTTIASMYIEKGAIIIFLYFLQKLSLYFAVLELSSKIIIIFHFVAEKMFRTRWATLKSYWILWPNFVAETYFLLL